MKLELLDLTLPVEASNDPKLLKDITIALDGRTLPFRMRIFDKSVSLMIGHVIFMIDLKYAADWVTDQ